MPNNAIGKKAVLSKHQFLLNMYKQRITLIQFAKFSAKILLMAKLLQNYSNLNDLEYSRHLKARKVEKRPKNFLKAKQRPEVEKPKFS